MNVQPTATPILNNDQTNGLIQTWLINGWKDFQASPVISLGYGVGFVLFCWGLVIGLSVGGYAWMLLPALSGIMLVSPLVAVGLYQKSRQQDSDIPTKIEAPGQIIMVGIIMMVLFMMWIRAATILFALFYGLKPFPGFLDLLQTLFLTQSGLSLIIVGTLVGGLFAAFTFAITVFSLPMLVARPIDAFTAMGKSFSASTHNFLLIVRWATVITVLTLIGFMSGMLLMIVIFPVLAYASWHAYSDVFVKFAPPVDDPTMDPARDRASENKKIGHA